MPTVLYKIPLVEWVRGTMERMDIAQSKEMKDWRGCWIRAYKGLGGTKSSGNKECPMHAAYGLWRLGRITGSEMPIVDLTLDQLREKYGPNAAYAVLLLELLKSEADAINWAQDKLWGITRDRYKQQLHETAAESMQGALQVAVDLYKEQQIC